MGLNFIIKVKMLMKRVQEETNAAILMITHDLGTVAQLCSRVIVMYAGKIVEKHISANGNILNTIDVDVFV